MKEIFEQVLRIVRIFFPEQRKWIVRVLLSASLPIICGPVWESYLNAILYHYFSIEVSTTSMEVTGWILLTISLMIFAINEYQDRRVKKENLSIQDVADRKSMEILFSNLHLPSLAKFFELGKVSITYLPALHYFYGLKEFVQAADYHVHDKSIKTAIDALYGALSMAFSHGEYFVEMPNQDLHKFDSRRDVHVDPEARRVHDEFLKSVWTSEEHLRKLCHAVLSKYPDFDFKKTDHLALKEYKACQDAAERELKSEVTEFQLSVMRAILNLEEAREYPNLQALMDVLECSRVVVQNALDELIDREFVKHLYPGGPIQKYTVLKDGRAYYVAHASGTSNAG